MQSRSKIFMIIIAVLLFLVFIIPLEREIVMQPIYARDSDGTSSDNIISTQKEFDYFILLKTYPFGYSEFKWENVDNIKRAWFRVIWKTNEFGAGNIYLGYMSGREWIENGPFNASEDRVKTIIHLPKNIDINDIKFRFRGEDVDFGVDAIAWIKPELIVQQQVYGFISLIN